MREPERAQAAHFRALDPLLPTAGAPPPGEHATAILADGSRVGGSVYRAVHGNHSLESLWGCRVVLEINPLIGDTGGAGMDVAIGALLATARSAAPDELPGGTETTLAVTWPSRDVSVSPALYAHGFIPTTVLAVRHDAGESAGGGNDASAVPSAREDRAELDDLTVRPATMADLGVVLDLHLSELRYSREVLGGVLRDGARALLEVPLRQSIQRPTESASRVLLAESQGVAIGVARYGWTSPAESTSVAHRLQPGRWGHVSTLAVAPEARGRGVGRTLMTIAHRMLARGNVVGTYLYYDIANPRSSVFWPRQGYRPLWTRWTATPADAYGGGTAPRN